MKHLGLLLGVLVLAATMAAAAESTPADATAALMEFQAKALGAWDRLGGYVSDTEIHERVKGKLREPEKIRTLFVKGPVRMYCRWQTGGAYTGLQIAYMPAKDGANNFRALEPGMAGLAGVLKLALDSYLIDKFYPHRHLVSEYNEGHLLKESDDVLHKAAAIGKLHAADGGVVTDLLSGRPAHKFNVEFSDNPADGLKYRRSVFGYDEQTALLLYVENYDLKDQLCECYKFNNFEVNPATTDANFELKKL